MNAEQQQAYDWAKSHDYPSVAARYARELATVVDDLQAQLSESRRREQAAVEDMTKMAKCKLLGTCTFCEHRNTPDARYKPCKGCIQENRSRKNFEWRGPQTGKGESDARRYQ